MNYIYQARRQWRVFIEHKESYRPFFKTLEEAIEFRDQTLNTIHQYTELSDGISMDVDGETFFFDKNMLSEISQCLWTLSSHNRTPMPRTRIKTRLAPSGSSTYLPYLILNPKENEKLEFIDGDHHNLKRDNLKVVLKTKLQGIIYEEEGYYVASIVRSGTDHTKKFPLTRFGKRRAEKWIKSIIEKYPHGNKKNKG